MSDYTRILLRQGPDSVKNNVILKSGEPAYITDFQRLVIGDGVTGGGVTIGSKFLGIARFDSVSLEVFNVKPGYPGDFIFEETTNLLYVLSGIESFVGKKPYQIKTNYTAINKTPLPDNSSLVDRDGTLSVGDEGIDGRHIASYALGNGLQKNSINSLILEMKPPSSELQFIDGTLQLADGGIEDKKFKSMPANTIKARVNSSGPPTNLDFEDLKEVLGLKGADGSFALGVPIGTIIDFAGVKSPANYLPCDGRELVKNEYIELFSAIGDTWGEPTLSTFNIPNLNKRTTIGAGNSVGMGSSSNVNEIVGSYGGAESIYLEPRHLPKHTHKIDISIPNHTHTFTLNIPEVGGAFDVGDIVSNGYNNYIVVINGSGPDAAPQTTPAGPNANTNLRSQAFNLIKSSKPYIQQRVVDYIYDVYPYALSGTYTDSRGVTGLSLSAVCYRDTGYITDSIAADILNNANHRSVETGNLYFSGFITQQRISNLGRSVPSLPQDQLIPTIKAIESIGSIIAGVDMPVVSQNVYNNVGLLSSAEFFSGPEETIVSGLQNFTSVIANSGNVPVTTPINSQFLDSTYSAAASSISLFKRDLQQRVVDYVTYSFPYALSGSADLTSEQLTGKCFRDSGYIIDSLVADVFNDANHRSVETGVFYFSGAVLARMANQSSDVPTLPQDQVLATIQAISAIGKFITGQTMPVERNYTTNGILSADTYFNIFQNKTLSGINNFTSVISNSANIPSTTPNGEIDGDVSFNTASNLVSRFRNNLQLQIVEYVKYYFPTALSGVDVSVSNSLSAKCYRDSGYLVDALAADLKNNANHRSIEAGLFYFNGAVLERSSNSGSSVPTLPTNQVEATIRAISAIKAYVTGINIPSLPTPFTTTGILSSGTGAETKIINVNNLVDTMYYPLQNNGASSNYNPPGVVSMDDLTLSSLISSNKSNLQRTVSSYVFDKQYLMVPEGPSQNDMMQSFNNFSQIINDFNNVPVTTPSGNISDPNLLVAANNVSFYKNSLQQRVVDFVQFNYNNALSGSTISESNSLSSKCFRDSGFIIDSIIADLKNNTNHRSVETGVFYFSGAVLARSNNSSSSIPTLPTNQVESTISAISAIGAMIIGSTYVAPASTYTFNTLLTGGGVTQASKISSLIETMVYPLKNNGAAQPYLPAGSPSSDNISLGNLLLANKSTIQSLVSSYVLKKNYLTFNPLLSAEITAKCNRDVGYMIDAVANDLKTGVVAKSIQYAVAYWDGSTSRIPDSNIPNQKNNTLDVIEYLKKMSLYYANYENSDKCNRDVGYMIDATVNDLYTGVNARSIQYAVAYWDGSTSRIPDSNIPNQRKNTLDVITYLRSTIVDLMVKNSNVLTNRAIKKINNLIRTMIYPFQNNGLTLPYQPAGKTTQSKKDTADTLLTNKEVIQNKITDYVVRKNYLISGSDLLAKCRRDVGYMIDAIANDLKTGVNAKSVQYALAYWDGSASRLREILGTEIQNQRNNTIDTIQYLQSIVLDYVSEDAQESILTEIVNLCKDVSYPLRNNGELPIYKPIGLPLTPSRQLSISILQNNKTKIQDSVRSFVRNLNIINGTTEPWLTLQEKCNRDVGYMVDSIINDLKTGVNGRSVQYALSYWDGTKNRISGTPSLEIPNQVGATVATIKFLRDTTRNILIDNGIGNTGNLTYTGVTAPSGSFNVDAFTGLGDEQLKNDPVPNMQPSAVVNKIIKAR